MKKLFLNIKKTYFEQIRNGTKTEEYRLYKPYWIKKILNRDYTHLIFRNGYSRNAPEIQVEYLGYEIKKLTREFFGNEEVTVFVLKIGEVNAD